MPLIKPEDLDRHMPGGDLLVLQQCVNGRWRVPHLHKKHAQSAKNDQVELVTALCGFDTGTDDVKAFRSFGERKTIPSSGYIGAGLLICGACEKVRSTLSIQRLYCIIFEKFFPKEPGSSEGVWKPQEHEYFHAGSSEEAKTLAFDHFGDLYTRIVSVAPVVGYVAKDRDGKVLTV